MSHNSEPSISFVFFGTSPFSAIILNELAQAGFLPSLIVTVPDKPKGRKLIMTPPDTKLWGHDRSIPVIQLPSLKTPEAEKEIRSCAPHGFDVGIVASYGKIIPQNILDIPRHGILNAHPSLLPKLRGASPVQSAILSENETGVTVMLVDSLMDHGPIIAQEKVEIPEWPPYAYDLEQTLGHANGALLASVLPDWLAGTIVPKEQNHCLATTCGKIEKSDGEINLSDPADTNLRKIRAYHVWPGAYFLHEKNGKIIRVIVKRAKIENGVLILERVVPEGKKEMDYSDFSKGYGSIL